MKTAQITVEYLDHLGTDLTVVNAARTSFGKESWWADVEKLTLKEGDAGLIRYLATGYRTKEWDEFLDEIMGYALRYDRDAAKVLLTNALHAYKRRAQHWAPFAHPHMQIRMQLPIFLARQFVKHQVGGVWSEESRRYISDEPEVWFPEEWHTRPDDIKQGSGGLIEHQDEARGYAEDVVSLALEKYFLLQDLGVAPEEARIVLPLNTMTTVTWTGSLLFWSRVCNQRVDSHAQKAAQELGKKISDIAQPLFPTSWAALVG
jgi:thymidylate synthase (FAD)